MELKMSNTMKAMKNPPHYSPLPAKVYVDTDTNTTTVQLNLTFTSATLRASRLRAEERAAALDSNQSVPFRASYEAA
jgi:hypothetical protein